MSDSPSTTAMSKVAFDAGVLSEPRLLFGGGQEHVDPKLGLSLFGPYCPADQANPVMTSIRVGIVGPGSAVSDTERWLEACSGLIANDGSQPFLAPEFPGFTEAMPFQCRLIFGDPMRSILTEKDIKGALAPTNLFERIRSVARVYSEGIETLNQREPRPDVVICSLPQEVIDVCAAQLTKSGELKRRRIPKAEKRARDAAERGQGFLFTEMDPTVNFDDETWQFSDLRRAIKVMAMQYGMPTQLAWPRAIALQNAEEQQAQDRATRAWNFTTALYYKAGGTPWRWSGAKPNTCFVGISFYKEGRDTASKLRTAMAQTFTSSGDGYVLRGNSFEWDADREKNRSPHLDRTSAEALMKLVIDFYSKQNNNVKPARVVIHKSSKFWEPELEGLRSGCEGVSQVDLVALQWRGVQFYRMGNYPPLRGTYVKFSDQNQLLYTMGYVPIQRSYNGPRVPQPLEVIERHGDTPWRDILSEIQGLTKLNWNTAAFSVAEPITLAFARRVGQILAEVRSDQKIRNEYRFFM